MATSKAAPKAGAEADAPAKSKKMMLILIVGAVLLLAGGGGAAWFFLAGSADHAPNAKTKAKEQPAKPPVFMTMESFTVNLQLEDSQQFLQIGMTLQLADQAQADTIKLYMPQVRSRLLTLLSSKKASEILSPEGKKNLAAEIAAQVRKPFTEHGPEQNVSDVFFTSFVVQ